MLRQSTFRLCPNSHATPVRSWSASHVPVSLSTALHFRRQYSSKEAIYVPAQSKHTASVIFLHGLGDTGEGWKEAMEYVQVGGAVRDSPKKDDPKKTLRHCKFILPTAPLRAVSINAGAKMPAWYDIKNLSDRGSDELEGIEDAHKTLEDLIQAEIKAGIEPERIVVGGFSQGAAAALYSVFMKKRQEKFAGVLALSGYLPFAQKAEQLLKPANGTPVFMAHGTADEMIPVDFARRSAAILQDAGILTLTREYPGMGHSASEEELREVFAFLSERLPYILEGLKGMKGMGLWG